jgi:hypothetical protein
MKFRPTTAGTVVIDLARFLEDLSGASDEERTAVASRFNRWMDDLLRADFFGTEGQCDPRGDHRE